EKANEEMMHMVTALKNAIQFMGTNVALEPTAVNLEKAIKLEDEIDSLRNRFRDTHYIRLEQGGYAPQAGVIFIDMLNRLERIGDHVLNVNESAACSRIKALRILERKRT